MSTLHLNGTVTGLLCGLLRQMGNIRIPEDRAEVMEQLAQRLLDEAAKISDPCDERSIWQTPVEIN